ncbi:hypothetical protein POM88_040731 [Heracleum sosnowskyi]|uniref:Uncharacterized protein n=1 Tax=Heracleum sosnowskyi TaxID=360622 RepID=A0AAD8HFE6_9APIA|nr:hypothetical protein POM88_040731 [Heracleum sosnowskyi]
MGLNQAESSGKPFVENSFNEGSMGDIGSGILGKEIRKLEEFRVEWIEMLSRTGSNGRKEVKKDWRNVKLYDGGTERFGNDLTVLFGVFGSWCLRPEGFFPKISEGLRLLKMEKKQLQGSSAGGEVWLKENGIRHLSVADAEKIAKNRVYNS